MPSQSDDWIEVEIRSHWNALGEEQFFVYWETSSAYGSRGVGLSREAAERLAARLILEGPGASGAL